MEGFECACMGERVCAYGRVECVHGERVCIWKGGMCVHGEREGVYMEGVECAYMGRGWVCAYGRSRVRAWEEGGDVCIWEGWSVHARREGECVYGRGPVCMHGGEGVCVHMEGLSVCAYRRV